MRVLMAAFGTRGDGPLARAIQLCGEDLGMQQRARRLAEQLQTDGVEQAASWLEQLGEPTAPWAPQARASA